MEPVIYGILGQYLGQDVYELLGQDEKTVLGQVRQISRYMQSHGIGVCCYRGTFDGAEYHGRCSPGFQLGKLTLRIKRSK